ncbi:MAG: FAD-dependent monooxygenase [Gammaproteobacteria bacterium]|nr:FAD-dependent monooxygenase [Gammaproteobacteria bacterium]
MSRAVDIAIAGAGVVGATVACLLADAGFEVVVVDPTTLPEVEDDAYDLRVFSLTPATLAVLERAGIWREVNHERVARYRRMEVWDAGSRGRITFDGAEIGLDTLGAIVEFANLAHGGAAAMRERRVGVRACRLEMLEELPDTCRLTLATGEQLEAAIVLGCDGRQSLVRELAGIGWSERDETQQAVVANLELELPHESIARQRFLADGPLAFLPLPGAHDVSIVWSTTPEQAAWAVEASDAAFREAVALAFEFKLGMVVKTSPRLAFPLRRLHANDYVTSRVALAGDAAHTILPLAGQGLNLGLLDVACFAEVLRAAGRPALAAPRSALRRYARRRRGENMAMDLACEGLNNLFCAPQAPVRWARGLGLAATERLPFAKRLFMTYATGTAGDVPTLAQI